MADSTPAFGAGALTMPPRMEVNLEDCEVEGTIPSEIDGAFVRVGAEWYYPPKYADDAILNADGYISSFRISNGKVDYKGRWVETHRLTEQRKARKQIYGYYRNPYTDDKDIQDPEHPNLRTVSNTAPLTHAGKLFTLKEDGLPHEIDPNTLQTIGPWDFHGKWKSETFSAHPKLDPLTGEMVSFGYEATGLCSDDLWIYTVGPNGQVSNEVRTKVPYVSVIHDMALTHRHVVIPFGGYVTSKQRLLDGKIHWGWDQNQPSYIGVMPRDGDPKDMRWFKGPERCMMHTFNAHSEGNKVILYAPFYDGNFFPFFPPIDGSPWDPRKARSFIRKITLDLDSKKDTYEEEILWPNPIMDLGKVDPRVLSLQTRYLFAPFNDESKPFDRAKVPNGPARVTNSYGRFDITTGKMESVFAGSTHSLAEQTFIPTGTSGREGEGYLIGVASNFAERRSELIIADAERLHEGVIARVLLPFTAASQVHGEWSNARALGLS